jgi:GntR family transcriptional regulator
MKLVKNPPLYMAVGDKLSSLIRSQGLRSGDLLPAEAVLCDTFGVSRGTLREAMRMLEEEGVLVRRQGKGTFVASLDSLIHNTLDANESVTEMIRGKGMRPGALGVEIAVQGARAAVAKHLKLEPGSPVVVIKRVRTADGLPVAYTEDYLPRGLLADDFAESLKEGSLYDYIEDVLGMELATSVVRLKPIRAAKALARKLGVKQGTLLMFLQQADSGKGKSPFVYSEEYFIASRFEFMVRRRRKPSRG